MEDSEIQTWVGRTLSLSALLIRSLMAMDSGHHSLKTTRNDKECCLLEF